MNYGKKRTRKREHELASKGTMIRKKFNVIFCKALLICFFAVMIVGGCSAFGVISGIIASAPSIEDIDATPTGYLTTVLDNQGNQTATLVASGSNRKYVTIDEIPINLQHAFVAIEDERFYDHNGIDLQGILRAGLKGVASGFHFSEGASTITQQLLKNTVFTQWTSEQSMADKFERKFQEQYLALQLEKVVDKDWILENYLNAINLGQNTLGVGVASERYFGKDVSDLTLSECAVLAAITQSPSYYNPITHPDHNKERRQKVLNNMLDQGYISQSEYDEAVADNVYDRIQVVNVESQDENINSYFVDEMTDQIVQDMIDRLGYTETQAYKALYQGGLTIESTQDPDIQNICDEEVNNLENYPTDPKVSFSYRVSIQSPDGTISTRLVSTYDQEDVAVAAEQAAWVNTVDDMLGEKIAVADTKFYITDPATGKRRIRSGETNLGDFVADGIYTYFNEVEQLHCDIAIMNGGGIRSDEDAGYWTFKTCKQVSPFGNVACLMSVTGKQIQDALEFAARFAGAEGKENGGFLHVAGATYEIHTDIPNTVLTDDKNVWMGSATGTPRVQNVRIYNKKTGTYEPLDLNRTYALAGMNYTLRNLGDGFAMFDGAELIKDYVSEDYLVMSTYAMIFDAVNDMPVLSSANSPLASYPGYLLNYENPYGAGRIQVV